MEMEQKFRIEHYVDTPQNRERLFEFYRLAYPGMTELLDPARFEWQSFQNPLVPPGRNYLYHLIDSQHRIVGQNILIPYCLMIDGKPHKALCSTNLIVLPEMVGKGAGHLLIEQHEQERQLCFAVGITPASMKAFLKRSWKVIDSARLYALFLRPRPCLRYVKKEGLLAAAASPLLRVLSVLARVNASFAVPSRIAGVSFEEIDHFNPEWDSVWQKCLSPYGISFVRSAEFLNWKYFSRADVKHHVLLIRKGQQPVGFLVYRLSRNEQRQILLGRIVDLVFLQGAARKLPHYMIGLARKRLLLAGVDGIVGIASSSETRSACVANGMWISRPQLAIIKQEGFSLDELRHRFKSLWYVTLADSDLDNYW